MTEHGAVSVTRIEAIEAGEQVMRDAGTAADAAIAACFVLGVVEPYMTGLGGVGKLVHVDVDGACTVDDAGARAPRAAHAALYGEPVGATTDPETQLGPLSHEPYRHRVEAQLEESATRGRSPLCRVIGGNR